MHWNELLLKEEGYLIIDEWEKTSKFNELFFYKYNSRIRLEKGYINFPWHNFNFGWGLREVSVSSKYKTNKREQLKT